MRTSAANLELDAHFDTGFVGNPKRFNTALSRAVALAVVVGGAAYAPQPAAAASTTTATTAATTNPIVHE